MSRPQLSLRLFVWIAAVTVLLALAGCPLPPPAPMTDNAVCVTGIVLIRMPDGSGGPNQNQEVTVYDHTGAELATGVTDVEGRYCIDFRLPFTEEPLQVDTTEAFLTAENVRCSLARVESLAPDFRDCAMGGVCAGRSCAEGNCLEAPVMTIRCAAGD